MDILWSSSTTMRNPERAYPFLKTIAEIDGNEWNEENQSKLQILLIKNRFYIPTSINLSKEQVKILEDLSYEMSFEEAEGIFYSKKYVDPPMRGRTSFDPVEKLGLVQLYHNKIRVTDFGYMFLNGEIDLGDVVFTNLLKYQLPNPLASGNNDYNTKPFINILRLIRRVNELCLEKKLKPVGISKEEFGIFALSIKSYLEVEEKANTLINFRQEKASKKTQDEKKQYVDSFIEQYLSNFQNPVKNYREYADNIIRYIRLTKYIYIRGNGYYIDLEPRRMIEIESILKNDNGSILNFTKEEYKKYISDYNAYILPFQTVESLKIIANNILNEINNNEIKLSLDKTEELIKSEVSELKFQIQNFRNKRTMLQNLLLKQQYKEVSQIDIAIEALTNIHSLGLKPSIALEKWSNIALNIINDAKLIKPNAPMGDDNEPTFTAPAGVSDIECYYKSFSAICEVTMLKSRDQWYNEGQPVMRHLREFEQENLNDSYCLFIAPTLHIDTINTFWTAVKYEYQGKKQRIVPITINQLIKILNVVKMLKNNRKNLSHNDIKDLYNDCIQIESLSDSTHWNEHINKSICKWQDRLLT